MGENLVGRRGFLVAAGAFAAARSGGRAAAAPGGPRALAAPVVVEAGGVRQVPLPDAGFTCSRQEGGKTMMAGSFTPRSKQVVVAIDIASTFQGWGGGYFDFHVGVLPEKPPAPWEPGGKNRIVRANNASRTPLPGVTEYQHFPVGIASANTVAGQIGRTIVLDGLTAGRVYQWEVRAGCLSFFKLYVFEDGARPTSLAVTADNLYAWAACEGNNRLALLQLGWSELWPLFGYSQEMLCVAEIRLEGKPGGIALQPKGSLLAVVEDTHHRLVLVDTDALAVVGSYAAPANARLSAERVLWDAAGSKVYVGGAADGRLHRFDLARREFDAATAIDPDPNAALLPLDLSADGRALWCSSPGTRRVYRVDLEPAAPAPTLVYTAPAGTLGPTCGAARKSDGSILFPDLTNNLMRHVGAAGALLNTWPISVPGQGTQHAHASVGLDPEQVRAFWTKDGVVGWAWIDSAQVINATHGFFPDAVYGDIAVTANEGTLVALPASNKVIQWPGGTLYVRPSKNDPGVYGAEHAHVTFTGAEATHE